MKLTLSRDQALKTIGRAAQVVPSRTTIPILSNILLSADRDGDEGGALGVVATDLDRELSDSCPALVSQPGQATVAAATLAEILRNMPEGAEVGLTLDGREDPRLKVTAGRSRYRLPILPPGDFPVMPAPTAPPMTVASAALKRILAVTRHAQSTEETRYYLNGAYLHASAEAGAARHLRSVGCDGNRLALADAPDVAAPSAMPGLIVPTATAELMRGLLDTAPAEVSLSMEAGRISLSFGGLRLVSKVIDGSFPDYIRVIPRDNPHRLELDAKPFAAAVKRVALISSDKARSVKLAIEAERVTLTVRNMEAGEGVEEVECAWDGPAGFEVGFNARYMLDTLGQVSGERVSFMFADAAGPCLVLDDADAHRRFVLMPLRV